MHNGESSAETKQECFLCLLDPKKSCYEMQIEGRILAALEQTIDGQRIYSLVLDTGTSRIEVQLDGNYYRRFIKELSARGSTVFKNDLQIRIYHLPSVPEISEYKGHPRLRYVGNAYTLAVLAPDTLLNITDLNQAAYCSRQYLLRRLSPSTGSPATIRGNLVHYSFKEMLKEYDSGRRTPTTEETQETVLETLQRHLEQALQINSLDIALANVSVADLRAEVAPHLESLARWFEHERTTLWDVQEIPEQVQQTEEQPSNQVRAETFLLAPEIGLRGRLDLFWQHGGRQRLLELKTGGASGDLPKQEHRWQVSGYHALLTVRRHSKLKKAQAILLYSGTPGRAEAFGIPVNIRDIQRVNETRNILVLNHITGIPSAPPGPSRCNKCSVQSQCESVSSLLNWEKPAIDNRAPTTHPDMAASESAISQLHSVHARSQYVDTSEDQEFFSRYYWLLQMEGMAGEQQQALLWKTSVAERTERGTAIQGLTPLDAPIVDKDGWIQSFRCANTSELREGDEVLISTDNPITGEVVSGTILQITSEQITVWTRELIAHPTLIDRYDNDLVHVRTLQNLLRWLQDAPHLPHLRDLIVGKIRPRFLGQSVPQRVDFNTEQNLAVERALQMQDYLLIQGPPGTGKTSVIAEIVQRLTQQGQRVMLAAFTNQAVDNMLKRLQKEGFERYLRLGHERNVDMAVKDHLLKQVVEAFVERERLADPSAPEAYSPEIVRDVLRTMPVIASTTATWSSDRYSPVPVNGRSLPLEDTGMHFDVAIIDEAGQLTVPAILGALRFAKRFILVGDEKQLPPLVLSKEAAAQGLSESLFEYLKRLDDSYMQEHPMAVNACVSLRTQYRMNKWISHFSSTVFYDRALQPHKLVANRRLVFLPQRHALQTELLSVLKAIEPNHPLVFLNVHDATAHAEQKISNAEARATRNVVASLLHRGLEPKDIGIIAPYRAQVANIRRHLFKDHAESGWRAMPQDSGITVDTVDRFQGGERMVIIISLATTQEPAVESQRRDFLTNPNRLNVALTRAQRKLILIGDVSALERLPTFSRLITYCRSMNTLIPYEEAEVHSLANPQHAGQKMLPSATSSFPRT